MKTLNLFAVLMLIFIGASSGTFQDQTDPKAEKLLNDFMTALLISESNASAKECLKHVHKSLKNDAQTDLTSDLRRFSFKKAHDNARFYQVPVKITRVRPKNITAIGFGKTAEKGKVVDYFIAKKEGENGMPAPVSIFFPEGSGEPKISYMGSL